MGGFSNQAGKSVLYFFTPGSPRVLDDNHHNMISVLYFFKLELRVFLILSLGPGGNVIFEEYGEDRDPEALVAAYLLYFFWAL